MDLVVLSDVIAQISTTKCSYTFGTWTYRNFTKKQWQYALLTVDLFGQSLALFIIDGELLEETIKLAKR